MLLYNNHVSGNCWKVRQIAAHLEIPLELVELDVVDRSNRPEVIGELNPALRVPTLVFDDGRAMPESAAILWYLAEGTEYLAGDEFTAADIMIVFSLTTMRHFMPVDLAPYPNILSYLRRIGARDAYQRAMRKGDPDMPPLLA